MLPFFLAITLDQRILLLLFISAHFTEETPGGRGWFLTKQPYIFNQNSLLQEVGLAGRGRTASWTPWQCSDHYSSHLKKPHTFPKTGRKKPQASWLALGKAGSIPNEFPMSQGCLISGADRPPLTWAVPLRPAEPVSWGREDTHWLQRKGQTCARPACCYKIQQTLTPVSPESSKGPVNEKLNSLKQYLQEKLGILFPCTLFLFLKHPVNLELKCKNRLFHFYKPSMSTNSSLKKRPLYPQYPVSLAFELISLSPFLHLFLCFQNLFPVHNEKATLFVSL